MQVDRKFKFLKFLDNEKYMINYSNDRYLLENVKNYTPPKLKSRPKIYFQKPRCI